MRNVDRSLLAEHALPAVRGGSKEQRGRVLVVAGDLRLPGTAVMVGEAAIRAGAGRLQIAVPPELTIATGIACPEAMVVPFDDVTTLLDDLDTVCAGPGMLATEAVEKLCTSIAASASCALLLDAGAFRALHARPDLLRGRPRPAVLTPHAGELAHMLDAEREEIEAQPREWAVRAARTFRAVTILKGERTYIASPEEACFLHDGGTSGLAVSGSGDALAGIISGLLSRGSDPLDAALWGVAVHAECGRRLEQRIGLGFLAREIAPQVPCVLRDWSAV